MDQSYLNQLGLHLLSTNSNQTGLNSYGMQASQISALEEAIQSARSKLSTRQDTSITEVPNTQSFPCKLFRVLSTPELSCVVSWSANGSCWKIHKMPQFTDCVLPLVFGQGGIEGLVAFSRQLTRYGFRELTDGPDRSYFYHEDFSRDSPVKCLRMRPTTESVPRTLPQTTLGGRPNALEQKVMPITDDEASSMKTVGSLSSRNSLLALSSAGKRLSPKSSKSTKSKKPKSAPRKRKKWLPPLGPPTSSAWNTTVVSSPRKDEWIYTSAETFALLSDMTKR